MARTIVIATGDPAGTHGALARHFKRLETYLVATPSLPGQLRRQLGPANVCLWDCATPRHSIRWTSDDRLIVGGGDQPVVPPQRADKTILQRTGQLMYELSRLYPAISGVQPECSWATALTHTPDGFPYIGPHRNYPRHLFALGYGASAGAFGLLAARMLLRAHLREPVKTDHLFGFQRART